MDVLVWAGFIGGGVLAVLMHRAAGPKVNEKLRCPHCGETGQVSVSTVQRKKGISGGKATGALFTGGLSMLATGLSRVEPTTHMDCGNCGVGWDV